MNKKVTNTLILVVALLAINFVGRFIHKRFDLTHDQRYTISETTENIIDKVDEQLIIRVYLEGDFPSEFKRLQIETRQYLEELRAKNDNIVVQFINPDSFRKKLVKKGMMPSQLTVEENGKFSEAIIFPWAEILYKDKFETVSLLPNGVVTSQEEQLQKSIENIEYGFSNAINNITQEKELKIAVLDGNGELQDIHLFSFLSEVGKKYRLAKFTLDSVAKNPRKTLKQLSTYDLAIIAKPTERFSDEEKLVLDQYTINGGKSLWMLENVQADQDSLFNGGKMLAYPKDLNLTDFFFSYGIRINNSLVKDLYASKIALATGNVGNQPQFKHFPWFYHPLVQGHNNHPITKNVAPVRLQFANQIDTLSNNIKKTPLLASSVLTQKIGVPNLIELKSIVDEPQQDQYKAGSQLFAVLLEGKFNSVYKNRIKPLDLPLFNDNGVDNKMIVIADGDIAKNQILKGKPHDLSYDKWTNEQFGNKEFLLNAVDYLLDDSGLIQLRNKNLKINILDKQKTYEERSFWQFLSIVLPLVLLFAFGFVFRYLRKRKYQ